MNNYTYNPDNEENESCKRGKCKNSKPYLLGGIIILAGILFLLRNLNMIPDARWNVIFSWPMILVVVGILNLQRKHYGWAGILILVGLFFLLGKFMDFPVNVSTIFWPSLLILAGIFILLNHRRMFDFKNRKCVEYSDNYFKEICIFGGVKKMITSQDFQGGEILAVFGGCELDLTHCNLSAGQNMINLVCVFGGCDLRVPADWNVKFETVNIFGGFEDKRQSLNINPAKNIVVKGVALFGGCNIRRI